MIFAEQAEPGTVVAWAFMGWAVLMTVYMVIHSIKIRDLEKINRSNIKRRWANLLGDEDD